jgi:chemotaxis methyl-accepting protein methylase
MNTICQGAPFVQRTLNGNRVEGQNDGVKSLEEQCDNRLTLKTHDLISKVSALLKRADANLGSYFDTEAQRELMKSIASRVNDAAMLALLEAWLEIAGKRKDYNGKKQGNSNRH